MSTSCQYALQSWGKTSVLRVVPWNLYQNERAQCPQLSTFGREWSEQNWRYAPRLKRIFALSPDWIWVRRKMTKPRLTVDIKIPRTPLMESNFTYVCEHHLIRLRFQYHCKRSSGSWIRRHGVRIPLLWPMYHILPHSIQYRLLSLAGYINNIYNIPVYTVCIIPVPGYHSDFLT